MKPAAVYPAINRVAGHFAKCGLAKGQINQADGYEYRSVDDVVAAISPLLAKHRLCLLPNVIERSASSRRNLAGEILQHVSLKVGFTISSARDGSSHTVETYGEALDASDKATAKAMSAAYKCAIIQVFCIPVRGIEDPDSTSLRLCADVHSPEPVQGWDQWTADIIEIVVSCETGEALDLVQGRNRDLLKSLGRERPQLYGELGKKFIERREALGQRQAIEPKRPVRRERRLESAPIQAI